MLRTISMLCVAAIIGVAFSTSTTCGIGLFNGTSNWCAIPLVWFVGFPIALVVALIFGIPFAMIFARLGFSKWWQYLIAATLVSVPVWYELAQPFESVRWYQSGFYDSLNYLGSGAFAGLAYWVIGIWFNNTRGRSD